MQKVNETIKKVYIVRHGYTDNNSKDLVQGEHGNLAEKGIIQAKNLAERLRHINFEHLLTSNFERAVETAEIISKSTDKPVEINPLLRELKRPSDFLLKSRTSEEYLSFLDEADRNVANSDWHFSDEENFFDALERIQNFFLELEKKEGDCVVVSHARMIMMMTMYVVMGKNLTPEVWRESMKSLIVLNTGITTIVFNEKNKKWQLEMFNDRAHFAE